MILLARGVTIYQGERKNRERKEKGRTILRSRRHRHIVLGVERRRSVLHAGDSLSRGGEKGEEAHRGGEPLASSAEGRSVIRKKRGGGHEPAFIEG